MLSPIVFALIATAGAVTDIERTLHETLTGEGATVAQVQAAWAETMGLRHATADGVVAGGYQVNIRSLDPADLAGEIPEGADIRHYVDLTGHGPEPLQLLVPKDPEGRPLTVYRRVEEGLFVEPATSLVSEGDYWRVDVRWPGQFVVHAPKEANEGKVLFPEYPPAVAGPDGKWHWKLYRVGPHEVVGPVPLLLIHGAGADRWDEFSDWARYSPEAEELRQHFQLWNFSHNMTAINAAIGYDPGCPDYEGSIITYLYNLLETATEQGVATGDTFYKFPADSPMTILTNSHGALKARAFMVNYPEYGDRVLAAVTLGGPHMGTPWATPEWLRYTASRFGLLTPGVGELLVDDAITSNYIALGAQSDLDMGWPNFDADGGFGGIPYRPFSTWTAATGSMDRVVSPRDANVTGARELRGFNDETFDPQNLLETYCGGMELITPAVPGDLYMDRFFLYGSYLYRGRGWLELLLRANDGIMPAEKNRFENTSLRIINLVMGFVPTEGADWPLSAYRLADGFIPLQSQLMLDGLETKPIYKTHEVLGWTIPVLPFTPDLDLIAEHTLGDPAKIRIWPGWSHLDTVTGRYNKETGHSELFIQVAEDLLSVLPGA